LLSARAGSLDGFENDLADDPLVVLIYIQGIRIDDIVSAQFFAPEFPRDSIECAEHKTSDRERRESDQETERTPEERPRTVGRKGSNQPERRKQRIENGAQDVCHTKSRRQRKRVYFP
jgi:hypothetical protein